MGGPYRTIASAACLLASLLAGAQAGERTRNLVLPNPKLIHCHSAECSQLWKQDSNDGVTVYPAQVLTDVVDGEVVALTAVYDKSVSRQELQVAIDTLYAKWKVELHGGRLSLWRVESEQLAVSLADGDNGTKQVAYLKFGTYKSLVPSAHIFPSAQIDCGK
jgi:hypothetical protein